MSTPNSPGGFKMLNAIGSATTTSGTSYLLEDIIVGKYVVKTDRYYTKEHEWALVKGKKAWIVITD